jgi:hypothetical protein
MNMRQIATLLSGRLRSLLGLKLGRLSTKGRQKLTVPSVGLCAINSAPNAFLLSAFSWILVVFVPPGLLVFGVLGFRHGELRMENEEL